MATSRAQFFDHLKIAAYTFDLGENRRVSETGGGELLLSDLGPRLWGGSLTVVPAAHATQRQFSAMVSLLRDGTGEFYLGDPAASNPSADPTGSMQAWMPPMALLSWAGREATISSTMFPLSSGDYFSFTYAGGKTGLHQVVQVQGYDWQTQAYTYLVTPSIRAGAVAGTQVKIYHPECKALIVPGSFRPAENTPGTASGFSFDWRQTLK